MIRRTPYRRATQTQTLVPVLRACPACQQAMSNDYTNQRMVACLDGVRQLLLRIRRCHNFACPRFHRPYRPEAEAHFVLPNHEFGLDVLAHIGRLRHVEHRSIPEIHQHLTAQGVVLAERTVTNLLDRYDELRALASADPARLEPLLREQGRVVLAIDGLQPDVGHEVLWVLRDCLSGEILLARSLLSGTATDLAGLMAEVRDALPVPITGAISDGQGSIRKAVAQALPGVPHQLCHFHYLREAARPIYEADRHAKKELKKRVRGIRSLERTAEGQDDEEAEAVRGYGTAVRSALTDDGRPPLVASGLRLHERLQQIAASLDRVEVVLGLLPKRLDRLRHLLQRGLAETAALWPGVRRAYRWVRRVARLLANDAHRTVPQLRRRFAGLLRRMRQEAAQGQDPAVAQQLRHFVKVTCSYRPGLFGCYATADLPRTNNDLEQLFGSHRYHERRASGRKVASPGLVVAGAVRVLASLATRLRPNEGLVLRAGYLPAWRRLRSALEQRREARRQQRRFRRSPTAYLAQLEEFCLK